MIVRFVKKAKICYATIKEMIKDMTRIYFCEKPSQAQSVAHALSQRITKKSGYFDGNDGNIYTYAYGHLTTLVAPEMTDPQFSWRGDLAKFPFCLRNIPLELVKQKGVGAQFKIIKNFFQQAQEIIVATDAGREGEHIFRTVYQLADCRVPYKRMWLQDMTDDGIRLANQQAKPGSCYDGLALAGRLRAESDWLVGMNTTIFAARTLQARISLGRVQTPTLKMLVDRQRAIQQFVSRTYYTLVVSTPLESIEFELKRNGESVELTQISAQQLCDILQPLPIVNWQMKQEINQEAPPRLFDLTELQKVCNKQLGLTASETLAVAQTLYEKKLITYPRTSSQYLTSDEGLLSRVQKLGGHEIIEKGYQIRKTYINPKKVTDHEALIPTGKLVQKLAQRDQAVFDIIRTRFFAAFYPNAQKLKMTIQFEKGDEVFVATHTSIEVAGWLALYGKKVEQNKLLLLSQSQVGPVQLKEVITQPPKPYNDSSLLSDMKNAAKFITDDPALAKMLKVTDAKGIGTPATRAAIIDALIKRELVYRRGKQLQATEKGMELISVLPDDFALCSPKMTAVWESLLAKIELGELDEQQFYTQLYEGLHSLIYQLRLLQPMNNVQTSNQMKFNHKLVGQSKQKGIKLEQKVICHCPKCNAPIFENDKAFACSGYKQGCKVTIWKNGLAKLGKKSITKTEAKKLFEHKAPKVKLKNKVGQVYEAYAIWNEQNNWITITFQQPSLHKKQNLQKQSEQLNRAEQVTQTNRLIAGNEVDNQPIVVSNCASTVASDIPDYSNIPLPPPPPEEIE